MPIRITGLASGLDTESIISAKGTDKPFVETGCMEDIEFQNLQLL